MTLSRDEAHEYLFQRINFERLAAPPYNPTAFKLEGMRELLRRLGDPQAEFPIVHVAGTKGKGSTSAMIAAALRAAGLRAGLFTSPHLNRVEERLEIDTAPCSEDDFISLVELVRPAADEMDAAATDDGRPAGPTFFELTTAMAFLHFARARVDAAVVEVGMGGRLDSTNVCQPVVSVITNISYDHTRQLGPDLASIAREKAGIVKPGVAVVSGVTEETAARVIEEVCRTRGSQLMQLGREFDFDYRPPRDVQMCDTLASFDFRASIRAGHDLKACDLALLGRHQAANAAVALAALAELRRQGWRIPEKAARAGLAGVQWPAHVETLRRRPTVIVDTAHNLASLAALIETLAESFSARRRVLIFGASKDKDVQGMLRAAIGAFDRVILTKYVNNPRRGARGVGRLGARRYDALHHLRLAGRRLARSLFGHRTGRPDLRHRLVLLGG